ncbi:hypothetical protein NG895_03690 [Aeoliella sp. ICT_H6.2]|uniref:Uncharacterized protein n=1 Tax=Aeoliella straminimaris TaxID=2954799 RepID=A0A9X2JEH0_9BACT|nr:hypothetical protein [Aeoliella straminimaris]MCO6043000.1 hypothetical protein [Aeoliella straminimaris]
MAKNNMLHFHTNVFARPAELASGPSVQLRGEEFSTFAAPGGGPPVFDQPLPAKFEEIQQRLVQIPRMDIEPDGYFLVAGGEKEGRRWQIDGHLFEYDGQMYRVEMHGSCSLDMLADLLGCFGTRDVVYQLVHEGVTLSAADFQRFAELPAA